ncbi:hypothetical protein [Stenotrophomonas phage c9-N]|nr:hypothetical protein [Stenotrophomonas phage c9-N]
MRKFYIIVNTGTKESPLDVALAGSEDSVVHVECTGFTESTDAHNALIAEANIERQGDPAAIWPRRAAARRALAKLRTTDWAADYGPENLKIVELGGFNRTTQPVKHWNIERSMLAVNKDGSRIPGEKWDPFVLWETGLPLREEARERAKELTEMSAYHVESFGVQVKYRAVPVYVEGK